MKAHLSSLPPHSHSPALSLYTKRFCCCFFFALFPDLMYFNGRSLACMVVIFVLVEERWKVAIITGREHRRGREVAGARPHPTCFCVTTREREDVASQEPFLVPSALISLPLSTWMREWFIKARWRIIIIIQVTIVSLFFAPSPRFFSLPCGWTQNPWRGYTATLCDNWISTSLNSGLFCAFPLLTYLPPPHKSSLSGEEVNDLLITEREDRPRTPPHNTHIWNLHLLEDRRTTYGSTAIKEQFTTRGRGKGDKRKLCSNFLYLWEYFCKTYCPIRW